MLHNKHYTQVMAHLDAVETVELPEAAPDDASGRSETNETMSTRARRDTPSTRKKRERHFTSDERARHRVIERERREAFHSSLLVGTSLSVDGTCTQPR